MKSKIFSIWIKRVFLSAIAALIVGCQSPDPINHSISKTATPTKEMLASSTNTQTPTIHPTRTSTDTPIPTVPTQTSPPPTKTTRPTATPVPLPEGVEAISLKTGDGIKLAGYLYNPEKPVAEPIAVLLAHEYYSSYKSWETFAEKLVEAGFTTLTFDFRGHGASQGSKDFSTVETDTKTALKELDRQGFEQIICMGASMGGTGCMAAAVDMQQLVGLVNLSGPIDLGAGRLITQQDLEAMTIPKIFMIAEEDAAGPDFVSDFQKMVEMAAEPKEFYLYPGYAHASGLLFGDSGEDVQEILLDFVKGFSQSPQQQSALTTTVCQTVGLPEIACAGVSTNVEWPPVIREFDGIQMALVPVGCYMMGSSGEQIDYALNEMLDKPTFYINEGPAHQQCFDTPFWIDVYEVTSGQYGSYDVRPGDELPRDYISWFDSAAHCETRGARLPTEAEWEYAARGPDSLIYPWGNEFDPSRLNYCEASCRDHPGVDLSFDDGHELSAPVGSFPSGVSWVGALDMSGNLWEWTSGILCAYPYSVDQCEVSQENDSVRYRTLRGGSWNGANFVVRTANRNEHAPIDQATIFGFRCVRSVEP